MHHRLLFLSSLALLVPYTVVAEDGAIEKSFLWIYNAFDFFAQIVLVTALLLFFWGLVRLLTARGDEDLKELAKSHMLSSSLAISATILIWICFTALIKYFDFESIESLLDLLFPN